MECGKVPPKRTPPRKIPLHVKKFSPRENLAQEKPPQENSYPRKSPLPAKVSPMKISLMNIPPQENSPHEILRMELGLELGSNQFDIMHVQARRAWKQRGLVLRNMPLT